MFYIVFIPIFIEMKVKAGKFNNIAQSYHIFRNQKY